MSTTVSVIIPAYNAGKHIEECLSSVCGQSHRELQILVHDDGSKDDTAEKLKALAEKDSRIEISGGENGGVSRARNICMEKIRGEYFVFLDSDDTLTADAIEKLLETRAETGMSLIAADRALVSEDGRVRERRPGAVREKLDEKKALRDLCSGRYCLQSACHKLFSTGVFGDIRFDEDISNGEDRLFVYRCIKRCRELYYLPLPLWQVRERGDSVSRSPLNSRWMTMLTAMDRMTDIEEDPEIKQLFRASALELAVLYIAAYISRRSNDPAFLKALRIRVRHDLKNCRITGAKNRSTDGNGSDHKLIPISRHDRSWAFICAYFPAPLIALYQRLRGRKE